jgi:uroporphyrinogen III methyltransferase/synthase
VVRQAKRAARRPADDRRPVRLRLRPEEAAACAKAGSASRSCPASRRSSAVPAYAGIPLTTKDHREVAVVTAGEKVDWTPYADDRTLVLLSGVELIGDIAKALVAAGRDPRPRSR